MATGNNKRAMSEVERLIADVPSEEVEAAAKRARDCEIYGTNAAGGMTASAAAYAEEQKEHAKLAQKEADELAAAIAASLDDGASSSQTSETSDAVAESMAIAFVEQVVHDAHLLLDMELAVAVSMTDQ